MWPPQQPRSTTMVVLGQKTQSGWWWQAMCLSFFLTPFLKPIGIDLVKKWEGKGENLNWNKTVNNHHQQKHKKCTQNIPFFDAHAWLHSCKHPYKLSPLPINDAQKNGQKRTLIDWDMVFFHAQNDQRKIAKFDNQTYRRTSERSENCWTINPKCSLVWDKCKVRKEKG